MATNAENLQTALDRVCAELAAGDIKPNYSIQGQSVSWSDYRQNLMKEARELRLLINDADADGGIAFEMTETYT